MLAAAVALIVFPALSGADATNLPVVTTDPATSVTNTSAKLNGTITPNDPDTGASYTFSWGQTTAYGNNVNGTTSPGTTAQSISTTLSVLPATTYHYMLCATNAPNPPGGTTCGSDQSFTTPDAPAVVAGAATAVTQSSANLAGTVNPNGATTSAVFTYGASCSPPAWTDSDCVSRPASPTPGSGRSPVSVSATLGPLPSGVTFHYTLCATNTYGTRCDPTDHTFVTNNPPTATLKENPASTAERQVSFDGSLSSDPDGSIQSWTLSFGDGTSTGTMSGAPPSSIVHTYPSAGSYTASLTVTDDDGVTSAPSKITVVVPSIAIADAASVTEGQTANFVVTLSAVSGHAVTVDYATVEGTAKQPGDYTRTLLGTLTIPAGQCGPSSTACQISVPTIDDSLYENNETFTVKLSNPTGAAIGDDTASGTIIDNDQAPAVVIANNARLEGDGGSTVNSNQTWSSGGNLTLGNASGLVSAPGDSFYLSTPGSTSTAPAGPYVFTGVTGNTLTGISPGGVALAGQRAFQPVPLTFTVALCKVADSITVDQCFQNQITSGRTTTVQFTTVNGVSGDAHVPVISGQDYVAKCSVTSTTCAGPLSPPITISPDHSTTTVTVSVIPNTVQQDSLRWFFLKLVSATNALVLGGNLGTGDIIDDDAANPPNATTGDPTAIGSTQATVSATVNPKGEATTAYVEYGTSISYGSQSASQVLPADGSDHVLLFNLTGLLRGTTYHYRVVATHDATHATGYGDDKTFTTTAPAPTAKTGNADPVDVHTATVHGAVNPHGTATTAFVEYGKTAKYGLRTAATNAGAGAVDTPVTFDLTGLAANTVYHYRLVAAHGGTKAYGGDRTFQTKPVQKPMRVSFASRKPVTVTANGLVPLALRCTGNVQKRCSSTVFLRFGKRAAGRKSIKLRPNRRSVVRVRLRPGVFSILKSKESLVLGVTITTSDGVESVQILSGSLKILAPGTQLATHTASTGSVVQCMTQVYKNGPVYVTSARNLTCRAAAREQRRYKWTGKNTSFRTPGGYRCAPFGGGAVVYQIRCTKGVRAYRIEFAD